MENQINDSATASVAKEVSVSLNKFEPQTQAQAHTGTDEEVIKEDPMKQLILQEIKNYSPHAEVLTLSTLMAISQGIHICNISPPGQGKSRNTVELLKMLRIPFNLIAGHTTPRQFFSVLQKDGILIVDEGATILSDKNIINLLLNALWNGKIEWKNNKEVLTHEFKGVIIFNVNVLSNTGLTEALKDRIFVNELKLNPSQIKDKIMSSKDYKPNMRIWAEIRERLNLDSDLMSRVCQNLLDPNNPNNNLYTGSNPQIDIMSKIYHLIENGEDIKSVREIKKLKNIGIFSQQLVGDLTLVEFFRKTDEVWKILNMPIKKSEKVRLIADAKCVSDRQAYRIIDKFEAKQNE